jgi:hypothetical protein
MLTEVLLWSSSDPPDKYRASTLNLARTVSSYAHSNLLFINHPIIPCYMGRATNSVVKLQINKLRIIVHTRSFIRRYVTDS